MVVAAAPVDETDENSSTAWPLEGYGDCSSHTYTYIYIYRNIIYIFLFLFTRVTFVVAVAFFVVRSFVRREAARVNGIVVDC